MKAGDRGGQWTRYHVRPQLGVQVLHAHYSTHRYERHAHDFFVIGTVEAGSLHYELERTRVVVPEDSVMIINPGEAHDGAPTGTGGYTYRMIYIADSVVQTLAGELLGGTSADLAFTVPVLHDVPTLTRLRRLHQALLLPGCALEQDALLVDALLPMIERWSSIKGRHAGKGDCARAERVKDFAHAHLDRPLTSETLAVIAGVSRTRLYELFQSATGQPLHAYVTGLRLDRACRLLRSGLCGADVAVAAGFADQSHLIRRFRGRFGFTPGQYAAAYRTNVQDPRPDRDDARTEDRSIESVGIEEIEQCSPIRASTTTAA